MSEVETSRKSFCQDHLWDTSAKMPTMSPCPGPLLCTDTNLREMEPQQVGPEKLFKVK